jgi:hypothetical protein
LRKTEQQNTVRDDWSSRASATKAANGCHQDFFNRPIRPIPKPRGNNDASKAS